MGPDRELWLLAGQSNMEGMGDVVDGPGPHPKVRAFTLARRWELAREPLHWPPESPDFVHHQGRPQNADEALRQKTAATKGVGPGLWFGRQRAEETGLGIDLVCAAHGGTSLEQWLPQPGAAPGEAFYASMLESVRQAGAPLTGVLWYQGCNDTNPSDAARYAGRMRSLVAALRHDLQQPRLPWIVAQIGRTVGRSEDVASWNIVQDAQLRLREAVADLEVVSTTDLELDDWIHLSGRSQEVLGHRFALAARHLVDGHTVDQPTPRPRAAVWDPSDPGGWAVRVEFDGVVDGWKTEGLPRGFSLVDARGRDLRAVCRIRVDGDTVWLRTTTDELGGAAVAYGLGCDPAANLVDGRGQALAAFQGLAIGGLPPVTPWARSWRIHSIPPVATVFDLSVPHSDSPGWFSRVLTGWWYLVLDDLWSRGAVAGTTRFTCVEPMELEARLGNDVPFRWFLDGVELLSEGPGPRLTSTNIDFEFHRRSIRVAPGVHEAAFVVQPRAGGLGIDFRLARTDAPGPLPRFLDEH